MVLLLLATDIWTWYLECSQFSSEICPHILIKSCPCLLLLLSGSQLDSVFMLIFSNLRFKAKIKFWLNNAWNILFINSENFKVLLSAFVFCHDLGCNIFSGELLTIAIMKWFSHQWQLVLYSLYCKSAPNKLFCHTHL